MHFFFLYKMHFEHLVQFSQARRVDSCIDSAVPGHKGPFTNTCKGGLMQKGALKIFDPCKGSPEKITKDFPLKIEFTCFSMGLTRNFHGKKGALKLSCGLKGGPEKFSR